MWVFCRMKELLTRPSQDLSRGKKYKTSKQIYFILSHTHAHHTSSQPMRLQKRRKRRRPPIFSQRCPTQSPSFDQSSTRSSSTSTPSKRSSPVLFSYCYIETTFGHPLDFFLVSQVTVAMEDFSAEQISGHLQVKHGAKSDWRLQYCLLDATCLYIFKTTPEDKALKIGISKGFSLEVVDLPDHVACFKFTTPPDHTFYFSAEDVSERDAWVSALQKALGK